MGNTSDYGSNGGGNNATFEHGTTGTNSTGGGGQGVLVTVTEMVEVLQEHVLQEFNIGGGGNNAGVGQQML